MTTTEIPLTGLENASLKDVAWQLLIPATVQAKWNAEVEMVRPGLPAYRREGPRNHRR